MAKASKKPQYLLLAVYPACALPFGLYDDPQEALDYARDHPLPDQHRLEWSGDQADRFQAQALTFQHYGRHENERPNGYVLQRFSPSGLPDGYAEIPPYLNHAVVLPGEEPEKSMTADALEWENVP